MEHKLLIALALATGCAPTPNFEEADTSEAERRRPPMFAVDEIATPPITVVTGAENVNLLSFRVAGTRWVEMRDVAVQLVADSDGFGNGIQADLDPRDYVQDCLIVRDRDGAVVMGPESPDAFGKIAWSNNVVIGAGIVLDRGYGHVECDLQNTPLTGTVSVAAMIVDHADVELDDHNGNNVSGFRLDLDDSGVNESADYHVEILPHGEATVSIAGPGPNDIPLGTTFGTIVALWDVMADYEAINITSLPLLFRGNSEAVGVVMLTCYDETGAQQSRGGFIVNDELLFSNLDCHVPEGATERLYLAATLSPEAQVGDHIAFDLNLAPGAAYEFVGAASGEEIIPVPAPTTILGSTFTVVL